jgi:hypothetical protein
MALRQRGFDLRLTFEQPVKRGVELVLVDLSETEHAAQTGCGGHRVESFGGGELGQRGDQPRHDHGDDEIAATIAGGTE